MSLHDRIREARKNKGITQGKLGLIIGVATTTVAGYEKNREPTVAQLVAIADALDVDVCFLLQDEIKQHRDRGATPWEMENIIKKYRALDQHGKNTITAVLDCEKARCDEGSSRPAPAGQIIEVYPTRKYIQGASAGYGNFNDDASYEMVNLVKRPPLGTSFIISVNGDSMEPTFRDGDLAFVRAQEIVNVGEIGLFVKGADLFIKESGMNGLISHNAKYPIITSDEDTPIRTQGKILGICTADYLQR